MNTNFRRKAPSVRTWAINLSVRVFDLLQKGDSDFVGIGSWLESNQIIAGDRREMWSPAILIFKLFLGMRSMYDHVCRQHCFELSLGMNGMYENAI